MQTTRHAALLERSRGYMLFVETVDPESNLAVGSTGKKYVLVRRELLRKLWVTMPGFQRRWFTAPGRKRWRQQYRLAWDCFAVSDCDPLEVCYVIEGWWRLHKFDPADTDAKRVEYLVRQAFKFTDRLRAGREQKRQERRDYQLEMQAARESSWSWTRIRVLLEDGTKSAAELAVCLDLKPNTVWKTLQRHKAEVEKVGASYRLRHWTPQPNIDKKNVLYKPFPSILVEGVQSVSGVTDENSSQEESIRAAAEASAGAGKTLEGTMHSEKEIPLEDQDFYRWLEGMYYYDVDRYWSLRADPERYQNLKDIWKDETLFWEELNALAAKSTADRDTLT